MPLIMFTKDRATVEEHPQVFKAGEVYDLPEESCERWKRRGCAVDAPAKTAAPAADALSADEAPAEEPKKRGAKKG